MRQIPPRVLFVRVPQDVDVVREQVEFVRFVQVAREEREDDGEREGEPEERGLEEEVVVPVDGGDEPARGDDVVDGLRCKR